MTNFHLYVPVPWNHLDIPFLKRLNWHQSCNTTSIILSNFIKILLVSIKPNTTHIMSRQIKLHCLVFKLSLPFSWRLCFWEPILEYFCAAMFYSCCFFMSGIWAANYMVVIGFMLGDGTVYVSGHSVICALYNVFHVIPSLVAHKARSRPVRANLVFNPWPTLPDFFVASTWRISPGCIWPCRRQGSLGNAFNAPIWMVF